MSARDKIPAIYMIRNKTNGKVYIGATKDIQGRFRQYMWAVSKVEKGTPSPHPVVNIIAAEGWDSFEFKILESGQDLFDNEYRGLREIEYNMKYRTLDPDYGYNATIGGESGAWGKMDKYKIKKTHKKFAAMVLYDITNGEITMCYMGWRTVSSLVGGQDAGAITTGVRRGTLFANRYYGFYVDKETRELLYEYIKERYCGAQGFGNGGNSQRSLSSFKAYDKSYKAVTEYLNAIDAK